MYSNYPTGTRLVPGKVSGFPPGQLRPEMPPVQMPTIIIIVLFTVAIASRQYEFAGALAPLLAPWFARQFAPQRT